MGIWIHCESRTAPSDSPMPKPRRRRRSKPYESCPACGRSNARGGRILLTKYAVCAATLLLAAVIGHVLLFAIAAKSYPLEEVSAPGVILATVLLWLGSLFALSVALFFSVLIKNVLGALVATALTVYLIFGWVPIFLVSLLPRGVRNRTVHDPTAPEFEQPSLSWALVDRLSLQTYWTNNGLYTGETFAGMDILVCLIAAAVPFLAALWLFGRKNY